MKIWETWTEESTSSNPKHAGKRYGMSPRAIRALSQFNSVADVSLDALVTSRGVGGKTRREIIEWFAKNGHPFLAEQYDELRRRRGTPGRAEALNAARQDVIFAAKEYVATGNDRALREAVATLIRYS